MLVLFAWVNWLEVSWFKDSLVEMWQGAWDLKQMTEKEDAFEPVKTQRRRRTEKLDVQICNSSYRRDH